MPQGHGPRRARIDFSDAAAKQLENVTSEADIHALDRALVVVSVDPDIGVPIPGDATGPQLRQDTDDVEAVRVLYFVTVLRTVVVVAYIEVSPGRVIPGSMTRWSTSAPSGASASTSPASDSPPER